MKEIVLPENGREKEIYLKAFMLGFNSDEESRSKMRELEAAWKAEKLGRMAEREG